MGAEFVRFFMQRMSFLLPQLLWATRLASARGHESAVSLLYIDVTPRARVQRVFGFYMNCLH